MNTDVSNKPCCSASPRSGRLRSHSYRIPGAALMVACAWVWMSGVPAVASEEPLRQTVNASDLDLSKPSGVATLYDRVRAAARNVCKPWNADELGNKATWDSCRDATIARTVDRLNIPLLTTYYMAKVRGHDKRPALARRD